MFLLCCSWASEPAVAENWTRFRGPNGSGISESQNVPLEWDSEKNIKWSVEIPGLGSSSPVIFDDRILLTSYTGYGLDNENPGDVKDLKRHLFCFDRSTGKQVWKTTVDSDHDEDPYKGFIREHGYASSTPVTDGQQAFVLFGKTGLIAFDVDGNQQWKVNLGTQSDRTHWGGGASCVLYKDSVIVNAGNVGNSIVALNKADGSEKWKVEDDTFTGCWSTPSVVTTDGHDELVFSMPGKILALNPDEGTELWRADSPIGKTVSSSIAVADGVVFAMGGRGGNAVAIKCGGKGDVTQTHTLWEAPLRSGIGTPLIVNGRMYWTTKGIAYCADCETGEYVYKERMKKSTGGRPAGDYASPLSVGTNIIMVTRDGTTVVLAEGEEFKQLSINKIQDEGLFNATPAISNGEIFLRSEKRLFCVAAE